MIMMMVIRMMMMIIIIIIIVIVIIIIITFRTLNNLDRLGFEVAFNCLRFHLRTSACEFYFNDEF